MALALVAAIGAASACRGDARADILPLRHEVIVDPVLRMTAFDVGVPNGWTYQGAYLPGSDCINIPYPVFAARSPDGTMELRRMPRFDWVWTNNPFAPKKSCLPLQQELSAAEFLKTLSATMQVAYVGEIPIPPALIQRQRDNIAQINDVSRQQAAPLGLSPLVQSADIAAARVAFRDRSGIVEAQLSAQLRCSRSTFRGPQGTFFTNSCSASVREIRAPQGKLDALVEAIDGAPTGARENAEWVSAYLKQQAEISRQIILGIFDRSNAVMAARQAEFNRAQAVRQQQNDQFIATMRDGTDRAMARARAAADARQTAASDWVDFALDRQTFAGSNGVNHITNPQPYQWSDGNGTQLGTNDPNFNPNGYAPGTNWTPDVRVHGNGQPYR